MIEIGTDDGRNEDGLASDRAALDLLRLKFGQDGAATILGSCIAAAATQIVAARGGRHDALERASEAVAERAFAILRFVERIAR